MIKNILLDCDGVLYPLKELSTKEIVETSSNVGLMKHMLFEIGYELKDAEIPVIDNQQNIDNQNQEIQNAN